MAGSIEADPAVPVAPDRAPAGWLPVVISNGAVAQQEAKLRHTGLTSSCLRRWVPSDGDHALTSVTADRRAAARRTNLAARLSVAATGWPARNSW